MATFSAQNFRQSVGNYGPNSLAARPTRVPGAGYNPPLRPLPTAAPAPSRLVMPARPATSPAPQAARPASRPSGIRAFTLPVAPLAPQYDPLGKLRGANGEELPALGSPLDLADGRQRPGEIPIGPLNDGVPSWLGSPLDTPLPFGGFRAQGGPVAPGAAYVVGENAPELFVPEVPGQIVPLNSLDRNPVNGRPSSFDGMSRTDFFMRHAGKTAETGTPVYNDIRDALSGNTPKADPRSFGTGGMNFMGPPMPAGMKPTLDATTGQPVPMGQIPGIRPATGRLVESSMGGVKWQPGTGPLDTLPPQSPQTAAPEMPFGRGLPNAPLPGSPGGRIAQSPQNHSYDHGLGFGAGLAGRATRPIGRSANDPQRIAEQMRRRGDPSALLRFGMQQMGQDFARERDAVNFAQGQMMFGQQQQAMDARDARNFDQGLMMFGLQQGAMDARDQQNLQQQQHLEAQRRQAEQAAQEAERNRKPNVDFTPIPGTGYVIPIADGRALGTLPMQQREPVWAGANTPAFPKSAPAPKVEKPQTPSITWRKDANGAEVPYQTIVDAQGRASLRRVSIIDENGDGIDDRQQQPAPQGGAAAAATHGALPNGTTSKGASWSLSQP